MTNIFEKASKKAIRFSTTRGQITVEDLWGLSLPSLDTIAIATNKLLSAAGEKSFIKTVNPQSTVVSLKMDILKYIIADKLEAEERGSKLASKNAKISQLKELITANSMKALAEKSPEELTKMVAELEGED